MVLPTIRRWLEVAVMSLLLVTISLPLTLSPQAVFAQSSTVSINPNQGPAGTQVTGSGTNWTAGDQMQVSWADDGSILTNTPVQSNGTFTASFKISSSAGQGAHNIYFTDLNSRYFLTAVFTVTANTPTVIVQKVFTADSNNNAKTVFAPGDPIRYMVEAQNTSSTAVTATVSYHASGPQPIYDWSGSASLASGPLRFYSAPTIPTTAQAGTYTITVTITYNGVSSSGQSQFTVNTPPTPSPTPTPTPTPTSTPTLTPSPASTSSPNSSSTPTPGSTKADLAVMESAAWKSAAIGTAFHYDFIVVNNGPADASGVTLTDNLPFQLWPIIGTIMSSQGGCPVPPASQFPITVTCQLGSLSVGKRATVFFTVGINTSQSVQPGMVINRVKVEGDQLDPNQANNVSSATTEIAKPSELTADELNASLGLARKCGEVFIDLPFFGEVNNLIDRLEGHQMTPQEVWNSLTQDTLDLIGLKHQSVGVLSKFFNVPACISYSREIFSIGP